jgi:hypothetical protein
VRALPSALRSFADLQHVEYCARRSPQRFEIFSTVSQLASVQRNPQMFDLYRIAVEIMAASTFIESPAP